MRKSIEDYRSVCNSLIVHEGIIDPSRFAVNNDIRRLILYDDLYDDICRSPKMATFMTFSARKTSTSVISKFYFN